eukprot:3060181-Prymnesium_polylepis.2
MPTAEQVVSATLRTETRVLNCCTAPCPTTGTARRGARGYPPGEGRGATRATPRSPSPGLEAR